MDRLEGWMKRFTRALVDSDNRANSKFNLLARELTRKSFCYVSATSEGVRNSGKQATGEPPSFQPPKMERGEPSGAQNLQQGADHLAHPLVILFDDD